MPQLFLDCDGVLANFDSYAEKVFGLPPRQAEAKLGTPRFWCDLQSHPDFYRNLPLMPDAMELFNAVRHLDPIILTGCPLGGWAEVQKTDWAAKHFPGTRIITTMSANKWDHMKPGDVLVDDYLKYKHLWEEAGGVFIHHTSAAKSIQALQDAGILAAHPPRTLTVTGYDSFYRSLIQAAVAEGGASNCTVYVRVELPIEIDADGEFALHLSKAKVE